MKLNSLREFIRRRREDDAQKSRAERREEEIKINYILNNLTHKTPFASKRAFEYIKFKIY